MKFKKFFLIVILMFSGIFIYSTSVFASTIITPEKARDIALKISEGGTVERFKFKSKLDEQKYFLTIKKDNTRYDIDINAYDGSITKNEAKTIPSEKRVAEQIKIGSKAAQKAARKIVKTGTVVKDKFVDDKKGPRYNVIIVDKDDRYDFDIYAYTEKVKKYEHKTVVKKFIALQPEMVDPQKAQDIALQQMNGIVIKCKLYHEKKHAVDAYKIDVVKNNIRYSYKINAFSGILIETNINYLYNENYTF